MIDANTFMKGKRRPKVGFPRDLKPEFTPLYGYYNKESNYYNVLPSDAPSKEMGGVAPILLGHFYPNASADFVPEDQISGYFEHKELKLGNKCLKEYPYSTSFDKLHIKSSDVNVVSVDDKTNKITATGIGHVEIEILNGDNSLFTFSAEVIDDIEQHVNNAEKIFLKEVISVSIENVAKFKNFEGKDCELEPYQLKIDIFSRNTGILESDIMLKKGALLIGCGSVGSLVAMELARAGVGRFFLIDMDMMGYHNICRHQCGVQDVGKFKTTAVKERILQINPYAEVYTANKMIQEVSLDELGQFCNEDTIVVGCADNREGDLYADKMLAKPYKMPFVSIGCWERAFAGEIFYCLPEGMPAYSDFVEALGESSGRSIANTHIYMGEVGSFEPGISADINFVTTIAVKMILDLLNRNNENYTQRLIKNLSQYTLICNTNNPKIGGDMAEIFSYPLQVTTSIEVEYANKEE